MKISVISLIIALAVAVLSVFQFARYQKMNDTVQSKLSTYEKRFNANIEQLNQQQLNQDQQIQLEQKKLQQLQELENKDATEIQNQIQNQNQAVTAAQTQENVNANLANMQDHWRIFEAYYLTELAQERLQTTYDLEGAKRLLIKAYADLEAVKDPSYGPIRDLMEKQINTLESTSLPNINEIWGTVNTLMNDISALPTQGLRLDQEQNLSEKKAETTTTPKKSWREALSKTWVELKDLVKIQRHTKPIEPILPQEEQIYAAQHLRLILEQMRWAILHNNQIVYEKSIQDATQWLNTYFEVSDTRVKDFEASLNVLAKLNVKPNLPDLSKLLDMFNAKGES